MQSILTESTVCAAPAPVSPRFGDLYSEFGTLVAIVVLKATIIVLQNRCDFKMILICCAFVSVCGLDVTSIWPVAR